MGPGPGPGPGAGTPADPFNFRASSSLVWEGLASPATSYLLLLVASLRLSIKMKISFRTNVLGPGGSLPRGPLGSRSSFSLCLSV